MTFLHRAMPIRQVHWCVRTVCLSQSTNFFAFGSHVKSNMCASATTELKADAQILHHLQHLSPSEQCGDGKTRLFRPLPSDDLKSMRTLSVGCKFTHTFIEPKHLRLRFLSTDEAFKQLASANEREVSSESNSCHAHASGSLEMK